MYVGEISLVHFKNHARSRFRFGERSILSGRNGSGKTNALEALYLLTNGILPMGCKAVECVMEGEETASVSGILLGGDYPLELGWAYVSGKRTGEFRYGSEKVSRPQYLERLPVRSVLFLPQEMNLLYLGPGGRRDFLDSILERAYPDFLSVKKRYSDALRARNALLKDIRDERSRASSLDTWDSLFSEAAVKYNQYRAMVVRFFESHSPDLSRSLREKYAVEFAYESKAGLDATKEEILAYLREKRERDIIVGHTYVGPHLDDFHLRVNGHARSEEYLSRGENKMLLLELKRFEAEFLRKKTGKPIIFLFDDIFSELDEEYSSAVFRFFSDFPGIYATQHAPDFLPPDFRALPVEFILEAEKPGSSSASS